MDRVLVVANAAAGSAEPDRLRVAVETLRSGADVELAATDSPEELDAALTGLDGRALIIAGGDGSLHMIVARLAAHELLNATLVGLVPLGTGNDFARGVGVPLEPHEAAEVCLRGRERRLDLLAATSGHLVVNAAHAGLGAEAAARSAELKGGLGAIAYPLGALIAGVQEPGYELAVEVDGQVVHDGTTLMVGIANGPCIGGGTRLCADAVPDDHALDVIVVRAVGPAARTAFASALRRGTHLDREDVLHVRGEHVEITGEAARHDIDGELSDPLPHQAYTVQPDRWRLLL